MHNSDPRRNFFLQKRNKKQTINKSVKQPFFGSFLISFKDIDKSVKKRNKTKNNTKHKTHK